MANFMFENYYKHENSISFLRSNELESNKLTLLFIHGLGDSGINYKEFFSSSLVDKFNIIVPDLMGHGKSAKLNKYTFKLQSEILISHLAHLEFENNIELNNIILIPHSMGAAHALLLYDSIIRTKIRALISVEGTITQYGTFISKHVFNNQNNFVNWFNKFKYINVYSELATKYTSLKKYYASLEFCDPTAFLENGVELYEISTCLNEKNQNISGKRFLDLDIPKIYCYGDQSLAKESIEFLNEHNLPVKIFQTENHFVMQQCQAEFVQFITSWIMNLELPIVQ